MLILQHVTRYSRKSLRVLGSVGEPINPSAWRFVVYPQSFDFSIFILLVSVLMSLGQYELIFMLCCHFSLYIRWFFNLIGDSKCPISDTWWQTETGGFMVDLFVLSDPR